MAPNRHQVRIRSRSRSRSRSRCLVVLVVDPGGPNDLVDPEKIFEKKFAENKMPVLSLCRWQRCRYKHKKKMTVSEFQLEKVSYTFNCNTRKSGSQYKFLMAMGRIFPTTLAQAKYFVSQGVCLDTLNYQDVLIVESMLNKHGYCGEYKWTKSGTWVRLINSDDLHKALKAEFNF